MLHRDVHWKRLISAVLVLVVAIALAAFVAAVVEQTDWDQTAKRSSTG